MRFYPAEPDIATLYNRIVDEDIDLQPDFQRGEVWAVSKQQRLIDTILRGWVVPPVLLVREGGQQSVLDGQQRLAAIRDFREDKFSVDGRIKPHNGVVQGLHGRKYSNLPPEFSKAFDRTTIRIYEITDFLPEEPAEIFFRLNQPTVLTSAEKRNAFFGPVRDEIRHLVESKLTNPPVEAVLGFSNARMAYDDVLARLACALEFGTLKKKITANAINDMYRRETKLSGEISYRMRSSLDHFSMMVEEFDGPNIPLGSVAPALNKATFFSWLIFLSRMESRPHAELLTNFYVWFEGARVDMRSPISVPKAAMSPSTMRWVQLLGDLVRIYSDRATSRVADTSSVVLRDFSLWAAWYTFTGGSGAASTDSAFKRLGNFDVNFSPQLSDRINSNLIDYVDKIGWGNEL